MTGERVLVPEAYTISQLVGVCTVVWSISHVMYVGHGAAKQRERRTTHYAALGVQYIFRSATEDHIWLYFLVHHGTPIAITMVQQMVAAPLVLARSCTSHRSIACTSKASKLFGRLALDKFKMQHAAQAQCAELQVPPLALLLVLKHLTSQAKDTLLRCSRSMRE